MSGDRSRFIRRCRILAGVTLLGAVARLAAVAWFWLRFPGLSPDARRAALTLPPHVDGDLGPAATGFALAVDLLVALPEIIMLVLLARLLAAMARTPVFPPSAPARLRWMAVWAAVLLVAQILGRTARGLIGTWEAGPGQRVLQISLSSTDLGVLYLAVLLSVLAWAFHIANRLEEDDRLTV
jgi:hypothetical protein